MSTNKSNDENITTHTEANYEELASQDQEYLDEAEEELRAILADDPSPSRNCNPVLTENCGDRELIQTDIRTIQTSDGPENAMFCASSTTISFVHKGQTQC
jgi:hypothetical protein